MLAINPCSSWDPLFWRFLGTSWHGSCVVCLIELISIRSCLRMMGKKQGSWETHAVVGWPSQSSPPNRTAPVGDGARTSSAPRANRRSGQSRCSCHHRIESGSRRQTPGPCSPCTARQASHGARPWRHWGGWGGGRPCREKQKKSHQTRFKIDFRREVSMSIWEPLALQRVVCDQRDCPKFSNTQKRSQYRVQFHPTHITPDKSP